MTYVPKVILASRTNSSGIKEHQAIYGAEFEYVGVAHMMRILSGVSMHCKTGIQYYPRNEYGQPTVAVVCIAFRDEAPSAESRLLMVQEGTMLPVYRLDDF